MPSRRSFIGLAAVGIFATVVWQRSTAIRQAQLEAEMREPVPEPESPAEQPVARPGAAPPRAPRTRQPVWELEPGFLRDEQVRAPAHRRTRGLTLGSPHAVALVTVALVVNVLIIVALLTVGGLADPLTRWLSAVF